MVYYVVTLSMPGYLPESNPYVVADDHAPEDALRALFDEVDRLADHAADADRDIAAWESVITEIVNDQQRAADFDTSPGSGFRYDLPDGYLAQATAYTREQLIELGYEPGRDFD